MSGHNVFNTTPIKRVKRNTFDLSHDVKFSCSMGKLIPTFIQECIPGDKFKIRTETLIRMAPLVSPVMHKINVFMHYFFVPNRIIDPAWEDFITPDLSKETPAPPYLLTYAAASGDSIVDNGSLADYMGLPTGEYQNSPEGFPPITAYPFAAYYKIYDDYYRDQNLQDEVLGQNLDSLGRNIIELSDVGLNSRGSVNTSLLTRSWQHDYFTSALPFAQKGPAVDIPISSDSSYATIYRNPNTAADGTLQGWETTGSDTPTSQMAYVENQQVPTNVVPTNHLYADIDSISTGTINDLRLALRLQEFFEKAARGGTRYIEQLKVHFNVNSSDKRLQRAEFIGGSKAPVIISEVLQTSESSETPQANMAGHGISGTSGKTVSYYAEEHGYIIGIMSVMPLTAYQQGIPRHFSRTSWEDYAWPTFAHLGEQEIKNKELMFTNDPDYDNGTFGYIPRYSEYRYTNNRVAAAFRSTLAFWHLGRIFDPQNPPSLNSDFIECDPRTDIYAVEDDQHLWCHSYHKVRAARALPRFGVPTL